MMLFISLFHKNLPQICGKLVASLGLIVTINTTAVTATHFDTGYRYDSPCSICPAIVLADSVNSQKAIYLPAVYRNDGLADSTPPEPVARCVETVEVDWMIDGTADRRSALFYNDYGKPIFGQYDKDGDGKLDSRSISIYDSRGNRTVHIYDNGLDGEWDYIEQSKYNTWNQITLWEIDSNGDGDLDYIGGWDYTPDGRLRETSIDDNGDGILDVVSTHEYNDIGEEIRELIDDGNDGIIDTIKLYSWRDGLLSRSDWDYEANETIDRSLKFEYDSLSRLLIRWESIVGDRITEYEVYEYDSAGRIVSRKNFRGSLLELERYYQYDSFGRVVEEKLSNYTGYSELTVHIFQCSL